MRRSEWVASQLEVDGRWPGASDWPLLLSGLRGWVHHGGSLSSLELLILQELGYVTEDEGLTALGREAARDDDDAPL
jgi:hypothetical protein